MSDYHAAPRLDSKKSTFGILPFIGGGVKGEMAYFGK